MVDEPKPEKMLDITGPQGETIFCSAKKWLLEKAVGGLQVEVDELWEHYRNIEDERLLVLVGALCIEKSVDALVGAFAPGFDECIEDKAFTFSVKIQVARSLRVIPSRILTACVLVRQIRNEFVHHLGVKTFAQLDPKKHLGKLEPYVSAYNRADRDPQDHQKLFRDLVGFTLFALGAHRRQVKSLREYLGTDESREGFKRWAERQGPAWEIVKR